MLKKYVLCIIGLLLVGRFLYKLKLAYLMVLCAFGFLTIKRTNRLLEIKRRFDSQFDECADYLQQMSFAFEKSGEIMTSLKECCQIFQEGRMRSCLDDVIEFLEHVYNGNRKEAGLRMIEKVYDCEQIRLFHNYMVELEDIGGDRKQGIGVLREEFNRWRIQVVLFQKECETQRRNSFIAICASMLLCASVVYLVPNPEMLLGSSLYQIGTTVFCLVNLEVFLLVIRKTIRNWIAPQESYSQEELERKFLKYYNRETRVGRRTLKKILQKEIIGAYPWWMLCLAIQIQNRDVAGAIMESEKKANVVLKFYLRELVNKIHDYPDSPKPYLEFLDEFKTPESVASMKTLYSISIGSCGDSGEQITELFRRMLLLQDEESKKQQEKIGALMYGLFLIPTLSASVKLIMDMTIILIGFTSQLGV